MKLIYCPYCGDLFQLRLKMKSCECGKVFGRYTNQQMAEVNEEAISVAIGNGDFRNAITKMVQLKDMFKPGGKRYNRADYQRLAKIEYAWVRPNDGEGNPHTVIIDLRPLVFIKKELIVFSNPKVSQKKIDKIARNLGQFVAPVYKHKRGYMVTDANHRIKAAIQQGYTHIPAVVLTKTEFDHVAYNKTASIHLKVTATNPPQYINEL